LADAEVDAIPPRLRELDARWHEIGAVPKAKARALDERFARARKAAETRRERLLAAARRADVSALGARAQACSRLEQSALTGSYDASLAERAREEWAALAAVADPDLAALERRFGQACAAVEGNGDAQQTLRADLATNLSAKRQLCIRMEVLAEVPSPEAFTEARMAYQVERLTAAMQEGQSADPFEEALGLERSWHLTGAVEPEEHARLEERFHRALEAFHRRRS
jgi:hypothetical protein